MFCSFRNGAYGNGQITNANLVTNNYHSTLNNGNNYSFHSNGMNSLINSQKSTKWHKNLLPAGISFSNMRSSGSASSSGLIGLHSKNSIDWKPVPSFWKYLLKYRRHFHVPFFVSLLAIFVNLPAFFEISAIQCFFFSENRLGYGVSYIQNFF